MQLKSGTEAEYAECVKNNSTDEYSACAIRYMEQWAALMEARMAAGAKLVDVADATSHEANTEGITGFMHGWVVGALSLFWVHGDELRIWHNAKHGVSEEKAQGRTVNPAILTIG